MLCIAKALNNFFFFNLPWNFLIKKLKLRSSKSLNFWTFSYFYDPKLLEIKNRTFKTLKIKKFLRKFLNFETFEKEIWISKFDFWDSIFFILILIHLFTCKIIRTLSKPFFAATSLALFVKSPKVLLLTYVKSSSVFLLTPAAVLLASKAVFEASCTDFVASPTAFFVCCVNYCDISKK